MLIVFCAVIPLLVVILAVLFEPSYIWVLNSLLSILGTLFSTVNFRFRKNTLSTVLLVINAVLLIYYVLTVTIALI
ncbi:hypothetical protein [Salinicoccus carnicancri]|uniref:hypothetical protein n=1 Tax=Salinicoccus carnicancri TaxID=558170 RepID=UPI0002DAB7BF|nr:hypothetical protein [Salinicoccus carnicancri]